MRSLSQENVATMLGLAQNSYSRIETNQAKLDAPTLEKLAGIFGVSPMDILSSQPAIVNFQPNKGAQRPIGYVEDFDSGLKEVYKEMLAAKDEEIRRLNNIIEALIRKG